MVVLASAFNCREPKLVHLSRFRNSYCHRCCRYCETVVVAVFVVDAIRATVAVALE